MVDGNRSLSWVPYGFLPSLTTDMGWLGLFLLSWLVWLAWCLNGQAEAIKITARGRRMHFLRSWHTPGTFRTRCTFASSIHVHVFMISWIINYTIYSLGEVSNDFSMRAQLLHESLKNLFGWKAVACVGDSTLLAHHVGDGSNATILSMYAHMRPEFTSSALDKHRTLRCGSVSRLTVTHVERRSHVNNLINPGKWKLCLFCIKETPGY